MTNKRCQKCNAPIKLTANNNFYMYCDCGAILNPVAEKESDKLISNAKQAMKQLTDEQRMQIFAERQLKDTESIIDKIENLQTEINRLKEFTGLDQFN